MNRSLIVLSSLIAALALVGCATGSSSAAGKQIVSAPTQADIQLAEKIKGEWTGEVRHAVGGGDLSDFPSEKMKLTAANPENATLDIDQTSFNTNFDKTQWKKIKAVAEKGVLRANQAGAQKFELKLQGDNELVGDYHYLNTIWTVKLKRTK